MAYALGRRNVLKRGRITAYVPHMKIWSINHTTFGEAVAALTKYASIEGGCICAQIIDHILKLVHMRKHFKTFVMALEDY